MTLEECAKARARAQLEGNLAEFTRLNDLHRELAHAQPKKDDEPAKKPARQKVNTK